MGQPQKFLFDVSFDLPDPPVAGPGRKPPPEPTFTRAELESARQDGFADGRGAALAEAEQSAAARAAGALEMLSRGVADLAAARADLTREAERQAGALLRTVLQRTVPALCRKDPLPELELLIKHSLAEAIDEPRVVLRVGDAAFDAVQARLGVLAQSCGYAGKLVLLADAGLADGDGRVEWADGGAERDTRRLAAEIDAILARFLAAPPPSPSPSEENRHE